MNSSHSPLRGLYWKEIRQVMPLIWMLLGVAALLIVMWSGFSVSSQALQMAGEYIPFLLPALYAAGVGAILVGQEKETRTLLWFGSLPIPPRNIVLSKFVVAILGLVVMWVCCMLASLASANSTSRGAGLFFELGSPGKAILVWFVHSLFILCCGFYTSWKLQNAFNSLLLLIPMVMVPHVLASIIIAVLHQGRGHVAFRDTVGLNVTVTLLTTVVVAVLGWRAAMRSLSPAEPTDYDSSPDERLSAWRPPAVVQSSRATFRYSLSSLVWQSVHHNRLALSSLAILVIVGAVSFTLLLSKDWSDQKRIPSVLAGLTFAGGLAVCWLGVYAFSGDGSAARLRFLADRGASPTLVWLSRHLIGISVIATAILLYAMSTHHSSIRGGPGPSVAMLACAAWIIYGVSQWTSQTFRILAASAVIAPILSGLAIGWVGFAASEMDSPFWLLFFCGTLPLITTWWSMRRYMDDSTKWPIWLASVIGVALFLLLPIGLLAIEVFSIRTMPGGMRRELLAEATAASATTPLSQSLMRTNRPDFIDSPEGSVTVKEALSFAMQSSLSPAEQLLFGDGDDVNVPLAVDQGGLSIALSIATYRRLQLQAAPEDETSVEAFGEWIEALTLITKRFRASYRWVDQEAADEVEIWLTQTLSLESMQMIRDREFSKSAIAMLVDQESRTAARRRAVLVSWHRWREERHKEPQAFGQFRFEFLGWLPSTMRTYMMPRTVDGIVAAAIEMIDAAESGGSTDAQRRRLHELVVGPTIAFADGPYSDRLRVGVDDATSIQQTLAYPANQWYARWETDAKSLASP